MSERHHDIQPMTAAHPSVPADKIAPADAIDFLRQLPNDSVDLFFADPPFNLRKNYGHGRRADGLDEQTYEAWLRTWLAEAVRVTKPSGSIFIHHIPAWLVRIATMLNEAGAQFVHWIAWNAMTRPMGKTLQPAHYGILFYAKDRKRMKFYEVRRPHPRCRKCGILHKAYGGKRKNLHPFGPLVSDVWDEYRRIRHKKYPQHPNTLPAQMLERIILMSTDAGDLVCDPFMGTGTTAVAARRLGRHFVGADINPEYVQIALERVHAEGAPSVFHGVYVSMYQGKLQTVRDKDWPLLAQYFDIPEDRREIAQKP